MGSPGIDLDVDARSIPPETTTGAPRRERSRRLADWLARAWPVLALGAAAVVVSVVVAHVVYPAGSWNRDEATYLWQVRALRAGDLHTTTAGFPHFFQPWLTGIRDNQYFSQYTLGWPLVMLVFDVLFGTPFLAMTTGTVLAVIGAYLFTRELTRDRDLALLTGILMLACPMIITQSGVYLGYLFSTGMGLCFGTALLAGIRRERNGLFVLAGALLGFLFITRPYDAVLWALGIGTYAVIVTWRRWSRQVRIALLVLAGMVPFLLLTLWHNHAVTGSFTQFPFTAKEPLDKFGFGYRRLMPHIIGIDYSVGEALRGTFRNAWYLPQFLVGSYVGLALAVWGLWLRRRDRTTIALLLVMAVFPFGYFWFWGNRLSSGFAYLSGPVYSVPLYVPLSVFIATALRWWWRSHRRLTIALGCVLAVATVPFLYESARRNHTISVNQAPWRHAADHLPGKSLVVIRDSGPYILHVNPFAQNGPDLDGRVLYAVDRSSGTFDLLDHYRDRTPYLERTSNPALADAIHHPDASQPHVTVVPLRVVRGTSIRLDVTARNPKHAPAVVVVVRQGLTPLTERVLTADADGKYTTSFTMMPASTASTVPGALPLTGRGTVTVVLGEGTTSHAALVGSTTQVQYVYRVLGDTLELLEPNRQTVIRHVHGEYLKKDVAHLPNLSVQAVPS